MNKILLWEGATDFLSKIADKVAVTYKTTKYASNSCIFTGIPIRVKKEKKLEKKKKKKIY